jgi:lipid II:glycine glycyltransferase (peptidoglycan interpeptide bridge formation enzyme)
MAETNQDNWDKKAIDLGGSILQSWAWGEFQKSLGNKVDRFMEDTWMSQVVEYDLMMSKKYWYAPRGPIGNAQHAADYLRNHANNDKAVVFLRLEPSEPIGLPEAPKEIQPKENWVVGLEGSEQELLVTMKSKHRYNINLAAKKGVTVRQATKNDFLEVWRLLLETAARGKFKLHPQNYYFQMWETLGDQYFKILLAEYEGQILACVLASFFGHTASYLHGGSSDKNKHVMAPFLLHWETMKLAKHLGYYNYDMGGVSSDPAHAWSGISRFKRGFGGFEVRYPGTFDLVLSPLWYNVYRNGRKLRKLLR